ncbi:MAG TPA: hypothetical protein VHP38_09215 [Ruminiclostridium sp.]|nr:hypothetical protein [Ruminiclostridium sp.]
MRTSNAYLRIVGFFCGSLLMVAFYSNRIIDGYIISISCRSVRDAYDLSGIPE